MKTKYIAAILSVLILLPSNQAFFLDLFSAPQVFTETKDVVIENFGMSIEANQFRQTTVFSNGTRKVFLSTATKKIVGGRPEIRINYTYFIHSGNQRIATADVVKSSTSTIPENQQRSTNIGIQTVLNPIPPPSVPPPPVSHYFWDNVIFLYQGYNRPTNGDPPFSPKYTQPDNHYSYWKDDLWTPWAFVVTKITQHLNQTELELVRDGQEDLNHLIKSQLTWAGIALGAAGLGIDAIVLFFGTTLTAAGLATSWLAGIGLIIAAIGIIVMVVGQYIDDLGYNQSEFIQEVVATERGDGFSWIDIRQGRDVEYVREPYWTIPMSDVFRYSERNYYISWGAKRDDFQYLTTEWMYLYESFPHDQWGNPLPIPHAHLPNGYPTFG